MEMTHKYMNLARNSCFSGEINSTYSVIHGKGPEKKYFLPKNITGNSHFIGESSFNVIYLEIHKTLWRNTRLFGYDVFFSLFLFFYLVKYLNRIRVKEILWWNGNDLFVHFSSEFFFSNIDQSFLKQF